jgi:TPR repeat protein
MFRPTWRQSAGAEPSPIRSDHKFAKNELLESKGDPHTRRVFVLRGGHHMSGLVPPLRISGTAHSFACLIRRHDHDCAAMSIDPVARYQAVCEDMAAAQFEDYEQRSAKVADANLRLADCVEALLRIAGTENAEVFFSLGDAFMTQRGAPRDHAQAKAWFARAAELGHTGAMVRLGLLERRTEETEAESRAVAWIRKAAELGNASAMAFLGYAYRDGKGVSADPHEARRWFLRALEHGDKYSLMNLGRLEARHLGSPAAAIDWFKRAAERGQADSFVELAILYGDRKSGVFDPAEAVRWNRLVANRSRSSAPRALLALARFTRDGEGTERNPELAKSYLEIALELLDSKDSRRKEAQVLLDDINASII